MNRPLDASLWPEPDGGQSSVFGEIFDPAAEAISDEFGFIQDQWNGGALRVLALRAVPDFEYSDPMLFLEACAPEEFARIRKALDRKHPVLGHVPLIVSVLVGPGPSSLAQTLGKIGITHAEALTRCEQILRARREASSARDNAQDSTRG